MPVDNINPVVVVPVHRAEPSPMERVSLRQCGKVLGHHQINILCPEGLDLLHYRELLPTADELRVDPHWMESIQAYNRMMISPALVDALHGYTHLLVHEPDALVIRDELNYWCHKPYDYIGAPWFEGLSSAEPDAALLGVGNSGFSLHRISGLSSVVTSSQRWYSWENFIKDIARGLFGEPQRLLRAVKGLGPSGQLGNAWQIYGGPCDLFWSRLVPKIDPEYKIAGLKEAINFSWEVLPSRCMEMTNGKLPFGIHAWAKYERDFLQPYLISAGVEF